MPVSNSAQGPEELGLAEPFIRFTKDDQYVDFELGCHPEKQNYFTVKVWGSSGSGGYGPGSTLLLRDPEKGDAPFDQISRQDGPEDPRKHPRKGEIVRQYEAKAFPGRFYYATYPIPLKMTRDNSKVRLRLLYKGPAPGPDVYRAYTHLDPFFEPLRMRFRASLSNSGRRGRERRCPPRSASSTGRTRPTSVFAGPGNFSCSDRNGKKRKRSCRHGPRERSWDEAAVPSSQTVPMRKTMKY